MTKNLIVRGAPQEYECHVGAWAQLPEHLHRRKLTKLLLLHGKQSWQAATPFFPDLTDFQLVREYYGGVCTDQRVAEVKYKAVAEQCEGILVVGGGKITDLAKQAAHQLRIPVIILPTLASTCAAYTPLSAMYTNEGAVDRFDLFPQSNALVLIDPIVILQSPKELLIAGIGDSLAKWYEADAIIRQLATLPVEVQVAHYAAQACRDNLLTHSAAALTAMDQGELNDAFLTIVETNILLAGMVGGFGDEYGRTAGAHSIHDALTILPESHHQLHGNKVAYGILIQLALENNFAEIDTLLPFYRELHLPTSLSDMDIQLSDTGYLEVATRATLPDEYIHLLADTVTAERVVDAMKRVEQYVTTR